MPEEQLKQLEQLLASGDEAAARKFVVEHFNQLPPEIQRGIAVELFRESMQSDLAERESVAELKKEAIEMLDALDKKEN